MTGPIKLLEKRLSEIKNIKKDACNVSEEDAIKIIYITNTMHA